MVKKNYFLYLFISYTILCNLFEKWEIYAWIMKEKFKIIGNKYFTYIEKNIVEKTKKKKFAIIFHLEKADEPS